MKERFSVTDSTRFAGYCVELLQELFSSSASTESIVSRFFRERKYLGSKDRAFISNIVFGIVRNYRKLEYFLHFAFAPSELSLSKNRFLFFFIAYTAVSHPEYQEQLQERFADIWNENSKSKSLEEFFEQCCNLEIFRNEKLETGIGYSFPDWMVSKLRNTIGKENVLQLIDSLNQPAPIVLRANTFRCSRIECKKQLANENIETTETTYSPLGLKSEKRFSSGTKAIRNGLCEIQDEGSQILAMLVNAKENETILDACAGSGGKSLAISSLLRNKGAIISSDISERKLDELRFRIRRTKAKNIVIKNVSAILKSKEVFADAVFVDAPCSSVGRIRRDPMLKWKINEDQLENHSQQQKEILSQYAAKVKPQGRLIYATCSFFKEENENVVEWFLQQRKDFECIPVSEILSQIRLLIPEQTQYLKLYPHLHDTDGFFAAVFKRV